MVPDAGPDFQAYRAVVGRFTKYRFVDPHTDRVGFGRASHQGQVQCLEPVVVVVEESGFLWVIHDDQVEVLAEFSYFLPLDIGRLVSPGGVVSVEVTYEDAVPVVLK